VKHARGEDGDGIPSRASGNNVNNRGLATRWPRLLGWTPRRGYGV